MKTRNIYLIVWLMLIACTAQAQLTCDGCADGTPDPLIPTAGGGTYQGDIVLTKNATFTIVGSGNFELLGVISGDFNIWLNAPDAKLILSGKNTYTGETVVNQGALGYGIDATNKSFNIIIKSGGVLSGGSSGNSGSINLEKLEFDSKESRFALYASGGTVSPIQLGEDGKGELKADNGGTIDIMDPITLPAGEYPIIQGKINPEAIPKFVIGKNNSGYCITVIQGATGIHLRLFKSGIITGPTAVCLEKTITLTAASEDITKDAPGEWTLKSNAGGGLKILQSKIVDPTGNPGDLWKSEADLEAMSEGTVTALFTVSGCDKPAEYTVTVRPLPTITFNPPVHPGVGAGVDLKNNPGSTNIGIVPAISGTMVTWQVSKNKNDDSGPNPSQVRISKDGSTLEDIPIEVEGGIKLTSDTPEAGPLLYKLVSNKDGISALTFVVIPQYTSEGVTCYGPSNSIKVPVLGYEVPSDMGSLEETPATTPVTVTPEKANENSAAILCEGRETNIKVGKEGDGNLYRWYSVEADHGIEGNSVHQGSEDGGATIKDRLTLSKKHPTSVVYYITAVRDHCVGATVRVPILINPTPSITTTLDKVAICNKTAPSIELATDIEEAEADKVTYTWTVSKNNVGAISASTPVKKIPQQTLTHTSSADESVIYSFIPAYTHAGVACAGAAVKSEVLVRGVIAAGTVTDIETSAETESANAGNINPMATLCDGGETNIRVGNKEDGNLYRWYSDKDNGVKGNIDRLDNGVATTIKDRLTLTLSKKHSTSIAYYITPSRGNCEGATVRVPILINPIPSITTTLDKVAICNKTAPSIELATDIEEAEAVTYTWTVSKNNVGAISASTPVKKIPQQTLTHTSSADESVIYSFIPAYTHAGVACAGAAVKSEVLVRGVIAAGTVTDIETSAETESAKAGNINPKATLCEGGETNIRVGKEGDGNLYRWYSDKDNGVEGNSNRPNNDGATIIKDRLTLSKKHSTSIAYYITPSRGNCEGATVRVPILINPIPSITTTLDKVAICNKTAPSIELATDIEEAEADKVTYTWTVSKNNVGAISASTPVKKIPQQTLTHTSSADESVTYSFIPAYTHAGVACAGAAVKSEVLVRGVIAAGTVTDIETSAETESAKAGNINPKATLCAGGETNIRVGKEGDGNLYRWHSVDADGVKGNIDRPNNDGATIIKDRLTLSKKHSTSIAYYITPSRGNCDGATVRVPILINPIPSITTTLDKVAICNKTAPNIELATDIEEAEADKVTYTWTVSKNNVGAISASTPVKQILPQPLTHTSSADESVIYSFIPAYTHAGVACAGAAVKSEVLVRGVIAAGTVTDIETSAETESAKAGNINPKVTLCAGGETNIRVGKEGDGNLYRWHSVDADGVKGNSDRLDNKGATTIKDRLTLSKKHSTSIAYYITPSRGNCDGATVRVPILINPTPSITTKLDKVAICNKTAPSIELATDIEEAEADKVTYTWTVSENKVGAISASTPVKKILPQTLKHTAAADESVIYSFIPAYTHAGVACAGVAVKSEVLVRGVIAAGTVTDIETSAETESAKAGNINPKATLCAGGETNIRVGKEGDGNLYRWYSDENNGVEGNSNRLDNGVATTIKDRLTLSKKHPTSVVYYITPSRGNCEGATVRVPILINPIPSITTTLDKVAICNKTAPSIELATDIEEAEADKVTYTWTVSENKVGAISASTPVKKIPQQPLTHTSSADESVIYSFIPAYTHAGVACAGAAVKSEVLVRGVIAAGTVTDIETSAETESAKAGNINPKATLCEGGETNIRVGKEGDGNLYRWYSDKDNGVEGNSNRLDNKGATIIKDRLTLTLTLSKKHSTSVVYYITPSRGNCDGATVRVPILINPIPSITTTLDKVAICNKTAPSIELATDIEEAEADKVTYTWTVSENKVGAISASTPVKKIPQQPLTHTSSADESVIYSFIPAYTHAGVACAGAAVKSEVLVRGVIAAGTVTDIETSAETESAKAGNINPKATLCEGGETNIRVGKEGDGNLYRWYSDKDNGVEGNSNRLDNKGATIIKDRLTLTLTLSKKHSTSVVYYITPSRGNCEGATVRVPILINPIPSITTTLDKVAICNKTAPSIELATDIEEAEADKVTYTWTVSKNNVGAISASTPVKKIPQQPLTHTSSADESVIYSFIPAYTHAGVACAGAAVKSEVLVRGVIAAGTVTDIETSAETESAKAGNINPKATLCEGGETNIRVGKEGDGNLYRWYSDENNGVEGNSNRPNNDGATTIKDRLTLSKKHSTSIAYYITPSRGNCDGATVRVPILINPIPSITTTLDKVAICNKTAPSIELATDIEEAEADKVTYTWTVPENKVGAISASTPVKQILPQPLTHTSSADESVIYSFIPAYTHAGVACAGAAVKSEVLVRGVIAAGTVTDIEASAETESAKAGNINPKATLCAGGETNIRVGKEGDGNLYRWYSDKDNGVKGNIDRLDNEGATIIKDRLTLTLSKKHSTSIAYYITPSRGNCDGATVRVPILINPIPSITTTLDKVAICNKTAPSIELATDIEEAEADKVTYTWTVPENKVGAISASTPVKQILPQPLTHTSSADESVIYSFIPAYTHAGVACAGAAVKSEVLVRGVIAAGTVTDIETSAETESAKAGNINPKATLCDGGETNIRVGKEGDGNLYRWYSVDADGVEGNSDRPNNDGATTIKDRLTLSKKHSTSIAYYITPSRGNCDGATVRVPILINPIPSITTTLDKVAICNKTAPSIELATDIEEAEADKVTYTWTVSENKVGAISASKPVKQILPQTLKHTAAADESVIYSFIPAYTHAGVACAGAAVKSEVLVRGVIAAGTVTDIETSAETESANAGNINPKATLCDGRETNIRVGKEGDGNLYRWHSVDADGVEGNSNRLDNKGATIIKDRLTLSKKHSTSIAYYITPSRGNCDGATVRVPILINPIPSITTTLDKVAICNKTAPSIELATDIEEAEAVTYTWTVSKNNVGAISASTPVKKILPQTLTHTSSADESVIYSFIPAYTHAGVACAGAAVKSEVLVRGVIAAGTVTDIETSAETESAKAGNINPKATLCEGGETNIRVGKEGDGNLYRWYSDENNGVEGNSNRLDNGVATTIKDRLTLSKKHSTSIAYYITAVRDHCVGEPVRVPILINPIPSITTTLDKVAICNNTATPSIELATDIEEAEADKVTYTWTVSENNVGAISESKPVKKILPQTLTRTTAADESVIYSFIPAYTHAGVVCAGEVAMSKVLVRGAIVTGAITGIETSAVCLGDKVSALSVASDGSGALKYQWMKDNVAIADANMAFYTIPTVEVSSSSYAVSVSNDCETKIAAPKVLNVTADAYFEKATVAADQTEIASQGLVKFAYTGPSAFYSWDFNDQAAISPLRNPTHKYTKAGTWTPTLTVVKSAAQTQCAKKFILSPLVIKEIPTGDIATDRGISVYPVPAKDQVTISSQYELTGIAVRDMSGKNVIHTEANGYEKSISVSTLPAGLYILEIINSNGIKRVKMIKE